MEEPKPPAGSTYAEFIAHAAAQEGRFEFDDGLVVDIGIPSDAHQDLAAALFGLVDPHLRGLGYKLRLASRLVTIPGDQGGAPKKERSSDALVICDGRPRRLVCEILSLDRGDDLGKKRDEYEAMPEFEEYLVIDSVTHWVRVYRRDDMGRFRSYDDHITGAVRLESIDYTLDLDVLYDNADIP